MKKVYSTEILANAWNIRNVLEQHDIESVVKNENLFSVSGEVPFIECLPEVWVKPLYYARAKQIIEDIEKNIEEDGPDWVCSRCGESNLRNYSICWSCENGDASQQTTAQ
jgi:Putative prokaryotic signal transducing protein